MRHYAINYHHFLWLGFSLLCASVPFNASAKTKTCTHERHCASKSSRHKDLCAPKSFCFLKAIFFEARGQKRSHWKKIKLGGQGYFLAFVKNKLTVVGGKSKQITSTYWRFVSVGQGFFRIQNRRHPKVFIHMERGRLEASSKIWASATSGHWKIHKEDNFVSFVNRHTKHRIAHHMYGENSVWLRPRLTSVKGKKGVCVTNVATDRYAIAKKAHKDLGVRPEFDCYRMICNPKTGKIEKKITVNHKCDDGSPFTKNDVCRPKGNCKGTWIKSYCKVDKDCKDDGNLCNGVPYCKKSTGKCLNNPASKISCPSAHDSSCRRNRCNPKTGKCGFINLPKTKKCDDGWKWTVGDHCNSKGKCVGQFIGKCKRDKDCKDDGNLCNGTPYCDKAMAKCKTNPATRRDWFVGTWSTNWSTLVVTQNKGCTFSGVYDSGKARIAGKEGKGSYFFVVGHWWRPKNKTKKCKKTFKGTRYWGKVRFDFPGGGYKKFRATWGYCGEDPSHPDWIGKRKK